MKLFLIASKDSCCPDRCWEKEFKKKYCCPECTHINPKYLNWAYDIYLMNKPSKAAVNGIVSPTIGIVRVDFLELFAEEAKQYLIFGKVYTGDGKLIDGFVTFRGKKPLLVRGSKGSTNCLCKTCGNPRYWSNYPYYILRRTFFDQPLYESAGPGDLVLREDLCARIDKGKWKGINIIPLPIRDEPVDGFNDLKDEDINPF